MSLAGPERAPILPPAGRASPRPRVAWIYALAAVAAAALVLGLSNPAFGRVLRAWPWEVRTADGFVRENALVFVAGAATLALLAAALLPAGRARATLALAAGALLVAALESRDVLFLSLPPYVPSTLAALAGGALYGSLAPEAGRAAGRAVAGTAAFVLAAILLYPHADPGGASAAGAAPSWVARIVEHVNGAPGADRARAILAPAALVVGAGAALAVVAPLALLVRVRALAWLGVGLAAVVVLGPVLHPYVGGLAVEGGGPTGHEGAAVALLSHGVPAAIAAFAAAADLVRRGRPAA